MDENTTLFIQNSISVGKALLLEVEVTSCARHKTLYFPIPRDLKIEKGEKYNVTVGKNEKGEVYVKYTRAGKVQETDA